MNKIIAYNSSKLIIFMKREFNKNEAINRICTRILFIYSFLLLPFYFMLIILWLIFITAFIIHLL